MRRDAMRQSEHISQHRFLFLPKAPDVGTSLGAAQHRGEGNEQYLAKIVSSVLVARTEMTEHSLDRFHRELPNYGVLPRIHNPAIGKPFPIYSNAIPLHARGVLVEAAWAAVPSPGPLRAFDKRIASRRRKRIAAVATARRLAMIILHMLSKDSDYIWARPPMPDTAPPSTTIFRPSAPKTDPASRRRKLPMQQRLPDGERGRRGRRLWKSRRREDRLFYNIRLHGLAWRDVVPFDPVIL